MLAATSGWEGARRKPTCQHLGFRPAASRPERRDHCGWLTSQQPQDTGHSTLLWAAPRLGLQFLLHLHLPAPARHSGFVKYSFIFDTYALLAAGHVSLKSSPSSCLFCLPPPALGFLHSGDRRVDTLTREESPLVSPFAFLLTTLDGVTPSSVGDFVRGGTMPTAGRQSSQWVSRKAGRQSDGEPASQSSSVWPPSAMKGLGGKRSLGVRVSTSLDPSLTLCLTSKGGRGGGTFVESCLLLRLHVLPGGHKADVSRGVWG